MYYIIDSDTINKKKGNYRFLGGRIMKRKYFFEILTFLMISIAVFGCGAKTKTENDRIYLSGGWSYALSEGDAAQMKFQPLSDDALFDLSNLVEGGRGFIWLCRSFTLGENLSDVPVAVYLGRITIADETYLNGTYIGGEGRMPPNEFSAWNTARFYPLPQTLIEKENNLIVKIWIDGEGSIVSRPFIGKAADAKRAANYEAFWNSRINLIFAFLMIVIAGYHFLMWLKDRTGRENLMFALINILSAMYLSVFYYADLPGVSGNPLPFLFFQKVFSSALPFLFPFLVTLFIQSFLNEHECRKIFFVRLAITLIPIAIVLCAPSYQVLRSMRWTQVFLVPPLIYILFILCRGVVTHNPDAKALLIGFSPLVASVLLDLLVHGVLKIYDFPYISSLGWQLVIVTLLFILANRFANSRLEVEELNRTLEQKVEKRTAELKESNSKLSQANVELEVKNGLLADAKRRADRDMKLAVYVQNSFYEGMRPAFKDWDIAYTFRPAAGVSGDLYDFFHDGENLQGVGLFDVSGHGIASGLVTMLAKTVIDRKFKEGLALPFNKVMKEINEQIVLAKGDIENYLTGVILRMKGDHVEYINAGHPKVFFRSGKSGKVVPIELKNSDSSGGIIGMTGIEPDFRTIAFPVHEGDSILLYTDCMSESKNKTAEEYGTDRIAQSFSHVDGSSKKMLKEILSEFESFTAGSEIKDDLTVIVLTYKPHKADAMNV